MQKSKCHVSDISNADANLMLRIISGVKDVLENQILEAK